MKRDFAAMRRDFVEGVEEDGRITFPTLNEVAARHSYDASNLRRRAGKEKWTAARRSFAAKVTQKTQEVKAKTIASKAAQLDAKAARTAERMLDWCERQVIKLSKKKTGEAAGMKHVADVTRVAQVIGRLSLGQPLDPGVIGGAGKYNFDLSNLTDDQLDDLADRLAP